MGNICETMRTDQTFCNAIQETAIINNTTVNIKSGNILDESDTLVIFVTPCLQALDPSQETLLQYFKQSLQKKIDYMSVYEELGYGASRLFKIDDDEEIEWVCLTVLPLQEEEIASWFVSLRETLEKKEIRSISMPFISIMGYSKKKLANSFISVLASNIKNAETHAFLSTFNLYCNEGVLIKALARELSEHNESIKPYKRVNSYEKEMFGYPFLK